MRATTRLTDEIPLGWTRIAGAKTRIHIARMVEVVALTSSICGMRPANSGCLKTGTDLYRTHSRNWIEPGRRQPSSTVGEAKSCTTAITTPLRLALTRCRDQCLSGSGISLMGGLLEIGRAHV